MGGDTPIFTTTYVSPVGELVLGEYKESLCLCDWRYRSLRSTVDDRVQKYCNATYSEGETVLLTEVKAQLDAYFRKDLKIFSLPLYMSGSDFQKSVWNALISIPYGHTTSYATLSENLRNPKAIRAVAAANGANAIAIIIPCHRVIGSNGDLVGYAGGMAAKKKLLSLESDTKQLLIPW